MELLKQVLDYSNVNKAYNHVTSNKGSEGVDGVTTKELSAYMQENWDRIKQEITKGEYRPQAVLGVEPSDSELMNTKKINNIVNKFQKQAEGNDYWVFQQ